MDYSVSMHKPGDRGNFPHVVHEPKQHILGFGNGSGEGSGIFVGHGHPKLGCDASRQEIKTQDPEKRKQGQSEKVIVNRPEHTEIRGD